MMPAGTWRVPAAAAVLWSNSTVEETLLNFGGCCPPVTDLTADLG